MNAGIASADRPNSRAENVVLGMRNIHQHIHSLLERAILLRDKISGGEPTESTKEGPRPVPSGLLGIIEHEGESMASGLSRLDTVLSSIERHF